MLGSDELTSFKITFASPRAKCGFPCTQPACCVATSVRLLLRITPLVSTSNFTYLLCDSPCAFGVWILTCGTPLAVCKIIGRSCFGAVGSALIINVSAKVDGVKSTNPNAQYNPNTNGLTVAWHEESITPLWLCSPDLSADLANSEVTIKRCSVLLKIIRKHFLFIMAIH